MHHGMERCISWPLISSITCSIGCQARRRCERMGISAISNKVGKNRQFQQNMWVFWSLSLYDIAYSVDPSSNVSKLQPIIMNTPLKSHRVVMFDCRNNTAHKLEENNQVSKFSWVLKGIILVDSNFIAPFALSCNDGLHDVGVFARVHRCHANTLTFHVRPVFHRDGFINVFC
jgi:hypothetical protein